MNALPRWVNGYGDVRAAILDALDGREMTTAEVADAINLSVKRTGEALARQANAGRVWVARRRGKAHVWALVSA